MDWKQFFFLPCGTFQTLENAFRSQKWQFFLIWTHFSSIFSGLATVNTQLWAGMVVLGSLSINQAAIHYHLPYSSLYGRINRCAEHHFLPTAHMYMYQKLRYLWQVGVFWGFFKPSSQVTYHTFTAYDNNKNRDDLQQDITGSSVKDSRIHGFLP